MIVYSYHEDAEPWQPEQQEILGLWHENWRAAGWQPKLLNIHDAKASPFFQRLTRKARALPTVNPKRYEISCFHRWAALHAVGGGMMTDYDVLNNCFESYNLAGGLTCYLWDNPCPAAVSGDANAIARWLELILSYEPENDDRENGQLHISDQTIIQKRCNHFLRVDAAKNYLKEGWEASPLIHFASGVCHAHGGKLAVMRKWMERNKVF